ncbi:MAG: ROK family protein [Herpetosiphonaceae bacterium]|nr:ROK family protein [Herpetosiphonaceae bacterium]
MTLYGGIESGGTKWVCAVGSGPDDVVARTSFPTTQPEETLGRALAFFRQQPEIAALGIGSFGPVDVHRDSPTWGFVTTTPKPGWTNIDVGGVMQRALGVPVAFDTDVNAAALGEQRWGAAQQLDTFFYLTIGTGIGGGVMGNGRLLHGLLHSELGHMRIPHDRAVDPYPGACPYHGDCLEGLAAGPALESRWAQRGETLPPDHPAWTLEAHYLALALVNLICILSPQRIILGGGVMQQPQLFPLLQREVQALLNGYLQVPALLDAIETYLVPPALGDRSGMLGAIALAQEVARS